MLDYLWPAPDAVNTYGLYGDYVGGIWGTAITLITVVFVYRTWRLTRYADDRNSMALILTEMLRTHDAIAASGKSGFWDRGGTPGVLLREFNALYRLTKKAQPDYGIWRIADRIDIAYTFAFYGLNSQAKRVLDRYGGADIKKVQDAASALRDRAESKYRGLFIGHQATLSHYIRNLYNMFLIVDKSSLATEDKRSFGKVIRTKLSNYDQALLMLNVISHLGRDWQVQDIVDRYKPFSNLPQHFFNFDEKFLLEDEFPHVDFEWMRQNADRPQTKRITAFGYRIALTRKARPRAPIPQTS